MKRTNGRPLSFSPKICRIIGEKFASGEVTKRNGSRVYGVSHGAIGAWKRKFARNVIPTTIDKPQKYSPEKNAIKKSAEKELNAFMSELSQFEDELQIIRGYHRKLFKK